MRNVVFSLLFVSIVVSILLPPFLLFGKGVESVWFIPGPVLAFLLTGIGVWLFFRWPVEMVVPVETSVPLRQKILSIALFLAVMPLIIGVMWYMWRDSQRNLSLYLMEALFAWIGFLLVFLVVSAWRKRSKAEDTPKP